MSENIGCYGEFWCNCETNDRNVRAKNDRNVTVKKKQAREIQKYCESADEDFAC